MSWHARLTLDLRLQGGRTTAIHQHEGPLRILRSLYPEGDAICHNVLVHPPGGLVGGDTLAIHIASQPGTHGLVTTPGATRFYSSEGLPALQHVQLAMATDSRFEWLPLETICHSGCLADNRLTAQLAPGAELLGWDITALGLPHANQPFEAGHLQQHLELAGHWLERGRIAASDTRLLNSPVGLAGQRCMGTLFFMTGDPMPRTRREQALALARECIGHSPLAPTAGATSPNPQVVVVRTLAAVAEPVSALLREIRATWRANLWNIAGANPRIWST